MNLLPLFHPCCCFTVKTTEPTEAVAPDNAICQILSIKKIPANNPTAGDRFRIILSDGVHFCQGKQPPGDVVAIVAAYETA